MDKTESKIYRELIGRCAEADAGLAEARVGDIKTIIGEVADALLEEDRLGKKEIYFALISLAKGRVKRKGRK